MPINQVKTILPAKELRKTNLKNKKTKTFLSKMNLLKVEAQKLRLWVKILCSKFTTKINNYEPQLHQEYKLKQIGCKINIVEVSN